MHAASTSIINKYQQIEQLNTVQNTRVFRCIPSIPLISRQGFVVWKVVLSETFTIKTRGTSI